MNNNWYWVSVEPGILTKDGVNVLLAVADFMLRNGQKKYTIRKKFGRFETVVTTDFSERKVSDLCGTVFKAHIVQDDDEIEMEFVVKRTSVATAAMTPPRNNDWEVMALIQDILVPENPARN